MMKLKQWLDAEPGRAVALALHLDVTKSFVSQMASGAVPIPPGRYRAIREFTGGLVDYEDMLPVEVVKS